MAPPDLAVPPATPLSPLANPPAACRGPPAPVTRYPRCCVCTRLPFFILVVCYWMSSFALVLYLNWIYVNGFKSTIRSFSPSLKNEGCWGSLFIFVVVFLSSKAPSEITCPSQDNMFLNSVVMFKWNTWTFLHTLIELKKIFGNKELYWKSCLVGCEHCSKVLDAGLITFHRKY